MDILAAKPRVGVFSASLNRFFWWHGGDEAIATVAYQVGAARDSQRFANFEIVLAFEELHQRALCFSVA